LEQVLGAALEAGRVIHAVVAANERQCQELWHLRDNLLGLALHREGGAVSHDISVPISRVPAFVQDTAASLQRLLPGVRVFAYGHLGDGNLHYNVVPPADAPAETASLVRRLVHDAVADQGGSIRRTHGWKVRCAGSSVGERRRHALSPHSDACSSRSPPL
jgi:FAD/FMN-containing dehydrogenase